MKYKYKARTIDGKIETGVVEAHSKEAAAQLLQKYNIFVTYLGQAPQGGDFFKSTVIERKISRKDLAIFFRQLAVILESRVPVVGSLNSLASQTKKNKFRDNYSW